MKGETGLEDSMIVELYWQRDEAAISETSGKYERYLVSVANNILRDLEDSMETVNETYLHAWNAIPPHRPDVLSAFLAKITRRLSIDRWRKKTADKRGGGEYAMSLQELEESGFEPSVEASFESESEAEDLGKLISAYLKTCKKDNRIVFVMRYFNSLSIEEICERTGFSVSKVKSMLMRMRNGLKDYLDKEGYRR